MQLNILGRINNKMYYKYYIIFCIRVDVENVFVDFTLVA